MSAQQHTPGPWKYQKQNGSPTTGQHMIAGSKPGYLAEVRDCGSGEVEANARLIAAAPELLAALQDIISWIPGREAWHTEAPMIAANKARAAIAKALGQ